MKTAYFVCCVSFLLIVCLQPVFAQSPPWKFVANDGNTSVTFGFLAQPQFESIENSNAVGKNNNSVFLRRFRFIAGGKITSKMSYFIESDSPNLGKKMADGTHTAEIFLQDAYVNYSFRPEFQLDGGMLIVPDSHNSAQSAATLLPIEYGAYSFLASDPTRSKNGRDYGVQARGYLKKHLEYRVGLFRGNRNHNGDFPYRYMARVVYYPLQADTGFFYSGTTLGQKKIVGIGASFDRQNTYSANGVDLFVDLPVRKGDAFTAQADFIRYDGSTTFSSLLRQNTWMLESSYYFKRAGLGPFFQLSSRDYTKPGVADDKKAMGGIALWPMKYRVNVKAGFARIFKTNAPSRTQFVIQTQLFYY